LREGGLETSGNTGDFGGRFFAVLKLRDGILGNLPLSAAPDRLPEFGSAMPVDCRLSRSVVLVDKPYGWILGTS
jgi:hypothetical protein